MNGAKLETEEILKSAGNPRSPLIGGDPGKVHVVDQYTALAGLVEAAQQFDERALAGAVLSDDGDDRAGRQLQIDVLQHQAFGARISKGHVVEADASSKPSGRRSIRMLSERSGVVLEPRHAAGAIE